MKYSYVVAVAWLSAGLFGAGSAIPQVLSQEILERLSAEEIGGSAPEPLIKKSDALSPTVMSDNPLSVPSERLTLDDLVRLAISTHPAISAKRADFNAAEADVQTARWQYFPTPSISARSNVAASQVNGMISNTSMILQQPLWAGGRLDAGLNKASSQARSVDMSITETQHSLAVSVTSAYQGWLQAVGRLDALRQSLRFHEEQTKSIRRRIEGGVSAEVDLELVNSRLAQTQADLTFAESLLRNSLSRLSQMTGKTLGPDSLARPDPGNRAEIPALDELIAKAEANYPALRRVDADVETAKNEVALRTASMWPTISLRSETNIYDYPATTLTKSRSVTDNLLMLNVEASPGAGLSLMSNIEASEARAAGMLESRESVRRDMINAIVSDYEDYRTGSARRVQINSTRKSAYEVLASYARLFVAGKRSWLDVLNAARELTQTEISLSDIEAQVAASAYRLTLHSGSHDWYRTEAMNPQ